MSEVALTIFFVNKHPETWLVSKDKPLVINPESSVEIIEIHLDRVIDEQKMQRKEHER
jgi:hypothetical protein